MEKEPKTKRLHPKERATFLSHLFFCWELPFFYEGYNKQITEDDLYGPLKNHRSDLLADTLEAAWIEESKSNQSPSLWKVLKKVFGLEFFFYGLLLIPIELGTRLSQPILLRELLSYYNSNETSISKSEAYIYASLIIVASFLYVLMGHFYALGLRHLGMKIRLACSSLIYRKSLKLKENGNTGLVINLLSNDVGRFDYTVSNIHFIWMGPLESVIILGLLYWMLGPTAVIGIAVLLTFVPVQMLFAKLIGTYRMRTAVKTDRRVKLTSEILGGMKLIKMYTWEKPFSHLVKKIRKFEMDHIKSSSYIRGINMASQIFLSRTALFLCILVYILTGGTLDAEYVYVLSSFYEVIRLGSVILLPIGMMTLGEALPSVKRITDFLTQPEMVTVSDDAFKDPPGITMERISTKENALSNLSLTIEPNQLVAIVGPVGSGKSTILQTILKEVPILQGKISVGGTISYASQEPWLFEGTIRENILFGAEYHRTKYQEVLKACALEQDLSSFQFGDRTLVGERGVILSGGQKARINLARAVYRESDVYLLDDPLSAVDANVAKQLFDCIRNYLKNSTRILVTHQLQHLESVDVIYFIENGRLVRSGTYQKFQNHELFSLTEDKFTEEVEDQKPLEIKESQQEGVVSNRIYRQYFNSGGTVIVTSLVILVQLIVQFLGSGTDYFLSIWVNLGQADEDSTTILSSDGCFYIYSGLTLVLILISVLGTLQYFNFCIRASTNLHNQMLTKVMYSPMRFFNTNSSGRILNRFSKDMGLIDEYLPMSLQETLRSSFHVIAIAVIVSIINPWILIPTILMFTLFYFGRKVFLASSRNLKRIEGRTRSPIYSHAASSLEGLATIRAFKAQKKLEAEFDKYQDLHSSSYYMFLACDGAFGFWLDLTCVVYLGIVTLSFLFIGSENYGANVGLSITQSLTMTGLLQWGMKQSGELENQMTSVERVGEYTQLEPEPSGTTNSPEWPSGGKIRFQRVSLRYSPDDPLVLKNLSFEIIPREKIGIVGRTGAGKSSLVSVLFLLAEIEGDVLIDDLNIKSLTLENLRSKITIIPQEPILFSGTIRTNLDPFEEYQDSLLWDALEEVELKSVVSDLSSQVNLSVGQRQLLCLARAVLKMNRILILDEATANVDPQTDELIQRTIRRKFRDCTVLTIAHRLNTVMDSDRILVMDDGCVVEFDRPSKLLENTDGHFYKLVEHSRNE